MRQTLNEFFKLVKPWYPYSPEIADVSATQDNKTLAAIGTAHDKFLKKILTDVGKTEQPGPRSHFDLEYKSVKFELKTVKSPNRLNNFTMSPFEYDFACSVLESNEHFVLLTAVLNEQGQINLDRWVDFSKVKHRFDKTLWQRLRFRREMYCCSIKLFHPVDVFSCN